MRSLCFECGDRGVLSVGSSAACHCWQGVDVFEWHRRMVAHMVQARPDGWVWEWLAWRVYCGVVGHEDAARLRRMYQACGEQLSLL